MTITTVAIIGCGAAGTTFFRSFIEECVKKKIANINIIAFESAKELGPGLAYQDDIEYILTNRPTVNMSAKTDDSLEFQNWLVHKKLMSSELIATQSEPQYASRKVYGLYLNEIFEKSIIKASLNNICTRVVYDRVSRIVGTQIFSIETRTGRNFFADAIVLCTGHNTFKDHYGLIESEKYVNSPYPLSKTITQINKNSTVGIIGSSLTAIDTVIGLQKTGFTGKITILSRRHIIPRVRGKQFLHHPMYLTIDSVNALLNSKTRISLRDILRLFRKEMLRYNLSWKDIFTHDDSDIPLDEYLEKHLREAEQTIPLHAIIPATNCVSEILWNNLDSKQKNVFLSNFQRNWINHRSSIPPINARLLLNMAKKGQLFLLSDLESIKFHKKSRRYVVSTQKQKNICFDWMINATGSSEHIQPEDGLLYNMINQGTIRPHPAGGIDVDFATAATINRHGLINPRMRIVGHNTAGIYQYTSSLELISKKSKQIAQQLSALIQEVTCDKDTKFFTTSSNRPGYSAQIIS